MVQLCHPGKREGKKGEVIFSNTEITLKQEYFNSNHVLLRILNV